MLSTEIATALSGAAIAAIAGSPAASAMPADPVGASGEPGDVRIVQSPPRSSAPSAAEATPDAGFDLSSDRRRLRRQPEIDRL